MINYIYTYTMFNKMARLCYTIKNVSLQDYDKLYIYIYIYTMFNKMAKLCYAIKNIS